MFHEEQRGPFYVERQNRSPGPLAVFHVETRPPNPHPRDVDREELRAYFSQNLGLLGLDAAPGLVERLATFTDLLFRWSGRMNLTGHPDLASVARNLVLDSLALSAALPAADSLADLGSGAGIPGLPIALARPRCRVTLVEARERRHHFQRAAVRSLAIANATPVRGRVETLEPTGHAIVMARAFAKPEQALEWMVRWAAPGALLALPGVARTEGFLVPAAVKPLEPRRYGPPGDEEASRLWLGRVTAPQQSA